MFRRLRRILTDSRAVSFVASLLTVGLICGAALAAETDQSSRQRLMFTTEPVNSQLKRDDGTRVIADVWVREIVRQAVLVAAREECDLATRDATLGEPVDPDSEKCIHIRVVPWQTYGIDVRLSHGGEPFYSKRIELDLSLPSALPALVEEMDRLSKTEVADALEKLGYPRRSTHKDVNADVPDEIHVLLQQMNHVSQYAALRQLHQMDRKFGESPAVLGGLARSYAHLAQLTLPVLDMRHRAFGARALLYAQRIIALQPDSPAGYWHRGYAFTWIGFPNGGAADLLKAKELNEPTNHDPPVWVSLLDDYQNFRFDELKKAASTKGSPEQQTAALLWFLASRMVASDAFVIETGRQALDVAPQCLRIVTGMSDVAGVAYNHQLTSAGMMLHATALHEHLAKVGDLPSQVSTDFGDDADISISSLTEAAIRLREAAVTDLSEPSWDVLGKNIRAWDTEILLRRALFIRDSLGIDAGEFVEQLLPRLEGDPFVTLFRALGVPRVARLGAVSEITKDFHPPEMNFTSIGYEILTSLPWDAALAAGTIRDWRAETWYRASLLEDDCNKRIRLLQGKDRLDLAKVLAQSSKFAPKRFSERIVLEWDNLEGRRDKWEKKYSGYPDLHWALAKGYKHAGQFTKSIESYERYVSLVPDAYGYIGLAEAYYQSGDDTVWLEKLRKSFDCEDFKLTHAAAAQHAASTLMHEGRFEKAREWAERSAASYSAWGVDCLIECLTGLGEFQEAESLAEQMTERYDSFAWYEWCAETGEGNLQDTWKAKQQRLLTWYPAGHRELVFAKVYQSLIEGKEDAARELLEQQRVQELTAWDELMLAMLADRAGDVKARDSALKRLADLPADDPARTPLCDLAVVFQHAVETGQLDLDECEKTLERLSKTHGDWSPAFGFFTGFYLSTHGEREQAVEQWKIPARASSRTWARILSWIWLRDAGIDPIHLKGRYFNGMFQR